MSLRFLQHNWQQNRLHVCVTSVIPNKNHLMRLRVGEPNSSLGMWLPNDGNKSHRSFNFESVLLGCKCYEFVKSIFFDLFLWGEGNIFTTSQTTRYIAFLMLLPYSQLEDLNWLCFKDYFYPSEKCVKTVSEVEVALILQSS